MCEEQATNLADMDKQQAYGQQLQQQLAGLMCHQAIADTPAEVAANADKWWRAGQYSDRFIPDTDGRGSFDFWYLCQGNTGDGNKCYTVISANAWKRKKEDPLATGQVWYCPVCCCRYRTSMGTLCEWRFGGQCYICLATYPPAFVENMKLGWP